MNLSAQDHQVIMTSVLQEAPENRILIFSSGGFNNIFLKQVSMVRWLSPGKEPQGCFSLYLKLYRQRQTAGNCKNGMQTARYYNNTLRRTASKASNYVYKSRGAPARGIGPPQVQLGKLLTSITSRLTLPKLHLATCNQLLLRPLWSS